MAEFRVYDNSTAQRVQDNYRKARIKHTVDFNRYLREKYLNFTHQLNIWDVFDKLSGFIDVSDPDVNVPNIFHLFQSAEAARKDNQPDWILVTCLIHDLGKIIYLWGCDEDGTSVNEQSSVVGDTFICGTCIPETIVFPGFNKLNPDMKDKSYNTKLGMYEPNCGLDNCLVSFGHDEYLYQMLKFNNCKLPEEAMYMIRYHSLYLYHSNNEYKHLMNEQDEQMLPWVQLFNKYDLYTKTDDVSNLDIEELKKYYEPLLQKYFGSLDLMF